MTPHWLHGSSAGLPIEGDLPGFEGATGWLNSPPLTTHDLRGRVVLVNFWTYTCVNWLRQLPYVRAWAGKYPSNRLVVVGVHTPEFAFERETRNVIAISFTRDSEVELFFDELLHLLGPLTRAQLKGK